MFNQQSRILLAFIGITLVPLSTAANWNCNSDTGGNINCFITLNSGNTFWVNEAHGQSCSHDGNYCASIQLNPPQQSQWLFTVTNNGVSCSDTCDPTHWCNIDNECWGSCQKEAC